MGNAGALVVFLVAIFISMFGVGMGNKDWNWNGNWNHTADGNWNHTADSSWPYGHFWNSTRSSRRIVVGDSENWHFGYNYTDWALKNGPFYLNDTLVFKFDPPNDTTFPHSVYLLPNYWSFQRCDLRRAKKVAEVTQGGGEGFEFVIKRWQPHYFACGERDGFHCRVGMMKFGFWPLIRWY